MWFQVPECSLSKHVAALMIPSLTESPTLSQLIWICSHWLHHWPVHPSRTAASFIIRHYSSPIWNHFWLLFFLTSHIKCISVPVGATFHVDPLWPSVLTSGTRAWSKPPDSLPELQLCLPDDIITTPQSALMTPLDVNQSMPLRGSFSLAE